MPVMYSPLVVVSRCRLRPSMAFRANCPDDVLVAMIPVRSCFVRVGKLDYLELVHCLPVNLDITLFADADMVAVDHNGATFTQNQMAGGGD